MKIFLKILIFYFFPTFFLFQLFVCPRVYANSRLFSHSVHPASLRHFFVVFYRGFLRFHEG